LTDNQIDALGELYKPWTLKTWRKLGVSKGHFGWRWVAPGGLQEYVLVENGELSPGLGLFGPRNFGDGKKPWGPGGQKVCAQGDIPGRKYFPGGVPRQQRGTWAAQRGQYKGEKAQAPGYIAGGNSLTRGGFQQGAPKNGGTLVEGGAHIGTGRKTGIYAHKKVPKNENRG